MKCTQHAVNRYCERFNLRKLADRPDGEIRQYLLNIYWKSKEIVPVTPTDTVHRVYRNIVMVTKDQKILTVFRFKSHMYKPKKLRHRYYNRSARKRRALRGYNG